MFLGPPLFRATLIQTGEARAPFLVHIAAKSSIEIPDIPELVVLDGKEQGTTGSSRHVQQQGNHRQL